jgi:hypothetical protein
MYSSQILFYSILFYSILFLGRAAVPFWSGLYLAGFREETYTTKRTFCEAMETTWERANLLARENCFINQEENHLWAPATEFRGSVVFGGIRRR